LKEAGEKNKREGEKVTASKQDTKHIPLAQNYVMQFFQRHSNGIQELEKGRA